MKKAARWALAGFLGLAGLLVLHAWTPSSDVRFSLCLWRRLLGIPCPGCGMTRAFAHLAKGEWRAALAVHPLAPFVAGELLVGWLAWGAGILGMIRRIRPESLPPLLLANLALLTALWMGRLAAGALGEAPSLG
jgi:hypothetical protein